MEDHAEIGKNECTEDSNSVALQGQLPDRPSVEPTSQVDFGPVSDPDPEKVVELIKAKGVLTFCNELGRAYASFPFESPIRHCQVWPISKTSRSFCRCLRAVIRGAIKGNLCRRLLIEVVELLAESAEDYGTVIELANRVAKTNDGVLWDMANLPWQAILVSRHEWRIVNLDTPRFKRLLHQESLPVPDRSGRIDELFKFIPFSEEADRLLVLAWLITFLCPNKLSPILIQIGDPGAAKSTRTRILRSLIDPSRAGLQSEIDHKQLVQIMAHHAVPCFDNLGQFTDRDSDFFCRACTGAEIERRQLYTDEGQLLLKFRRSIILNAVALPTMRSDFLDRCIVFQLSRLASFQSEESIMVDFEQARPRLTGALLNLLVATLNILPDTPTTNEFRMSDYVHVGRAVAQARGLEFTKFDEAYRNVLHGQMTESIDDDPLARAVIEILKRGTFRGTIQELQSQLNATVARGAARESPWPRSPRWLSTRLSELSPSLTHLGIRITRLPRTNTKRQIVIEG